MAGGFGERVRDLMLVKFGADTAAALARECRFSRQTAANLLKLESGDNVRGKHLKALANCFHVRIHWLLEGSGNVGRATVFEQILLEKAVRIIADLPHDKAEAWIASGRAIAGE